MMRDHVRAAVPAATGALAAWLALVFVAPDVEAARRSLRLDAGGWSEQLALASAACPGSYAGSSAIDWAGYRFQGHVADQSQFDEFNGFCQETLGSAFNESGFGGSDPLLAAMIGSNDYGEVFARRYTFEPFGPGFQWVFYSFPRSPQRYAGDRVFVVAYQESDEPAFALPPLVIDPSVVDLPAAQVLFAVHRDGFDGEYLCFEGRIVESAGQLLERPVFIGTWTGEPGDEGSTCYQRLAHRLPAAAGEGRDAR